MIGCIICMLIGAAVGVAGTIVGVIIYGRKGV